MRHSLAISAAILVAVGITASAFADEAQPEGAIPIAVNDAGADGSDASEADGGDGGPTDRDYAKHERNQGIAVAARGDFGALGWSLGLGGMHLWEQSDSYRGLGGIGWFAAGLEGRMFLRQDDDHVMGGGGFGVGRISFVGDVMGMAMEVSTGGAYLLDRMRAISSAGVFFGWLYLEAGYSYQFPIDGADRAGMIASHNFSARITVPVHWYSKQMTREYVPPRPQ